MFRLVTPLLGRKEQEYRWEAIDWRDGFAARTPGLNVDWRLRSVPCWQGVKYGARQAARELIMLVSVAGDYKGMHFACMSVEHDEAAMYADRLTPMLIGGDTWPQGPFALSLVSCVEGCNDLVFCGHPNGQLVAIAARLQRQLFNLLTRESSVTFTPAVNRVVALVLAGLTNREIAVRLCVTMSTVEQHVASALEVSGAFDRNQLIEWVKSRRKEA